MFMRQLTLPGIEVMPKHKTRKALGYWGENRAKEWFSSMGYLATINKIATLGDVRVKSPLTGEIFNVEVKTATRSAKYGYWQFGICHAGINYRFCDYLLLQAIVDDCGGMARFFIPVIDINQNQIVMRDPFSSRSKFAVWRGVKPPVLTGGVQDLPN